MVIYLIALVIIGKVTTKTSRKYFIPGLTLKFIGAIGLGLIYQFYYGGGDTFNYWNNGYYIYDAFWNDPSEVIKLLFGEVDSAALFEYRSKIWLMRSNSAYFIVKTSAFIDLFTFHTYSTTSLFFALFAFSGTWALFQLLIIKYPGKSRPIFIALFLMPSVVIWGSGLLKDSIAIGSLFWLIWSVIRMVEFRKLGALTVLIAIISIYLLVKVKVYILLCLFPCLLLYVFLKFYSSFRSAVIRVLLAPIFLIIFGVLSFYGVNELGKEDRRYQLENIASSSKTIAYDLMYGWGRGAGSGYTLGEHKGTWVGMLSLAPLGITTAIYRPFLWEASNVLMIIAALESFFIIILTVRFFLLKSKRTIFKDPFLLFCLTFSIVFAFAVGVSTFNFGTLSRYRVPLIPFHLLAITITTRSEGRQNHHISID